MARMTIDEMNEWLAGKDTRQLMKILKIAQRNYGTYYVNDSDTIHIKWIKEELSKREHIPNKQESKALRQEAAKKGNRRGRMDR